METGLENRDQELETCAQSVVARREPSEGLRRNRWTPGGVCKIWDPIKARQRRAKRKLNTNVSC